MKKDWKKDWNRRRIIGLLVMVCGLALYTIALANPEPLLFGGATLERVLWGFCLPTFLILGGGIFSRLSIPKKRGK